MFDSNCMYCTENEKLTSIMIPVCKVDGFSLYLHKNQTYLGRSILAYSDHVGTVAEMDPELCKRFFAAGQKVAQALTEVFHPGQVNLGMYADQVRHAHIHFAPKYEGGPDWGGIFQMNPQPEKHLTDAEYADIIAKLQAALAKIG